MIRTYDELIKIPGYLERFEYLKLESKVGVSTFGSKRWINQRFYHSDKWLRVRDKIITRDLGRDLACEGFDILGQIHIHHMNPLMVRDLLENLDDALNPNYLICASYRTHRAIHFSNADILTLPPVERKPNDTCPWKL